MADNDEKPRRPQPQGSVVETLLQGGVEAALGSVSVPQASQRLAPTVWLPVLSTTQYRPGREDAGHGMPAPPRINRASAQEVSVNQARAWIYNDDLRNQILEFLQKQGYQVHSFDELEKLWNIAVDRAAEAWDGGVKKTVFDILELGSPTQAGEAGPPKGQRYTQTYTTTDIAELGPETARAILTNALTEYLGRAPTQEEIEDFASRANAIVSANPQVTETTVTREWDEDLGDYVETGRTTRQIGPSAEEVRNMVQQAAVDEAMESDEYGAFQAATTYFNALLQAIASPTG